MPWSISTVSFFSKRRRAIGYELMIDIERFVHRLLRHVSPPSNQKQIGYQRPYGLISI